MLSSLTGKWSILEIPIYIKDRTTKKDDTDKPGFEA